jgi:hypothetical protein
MMAEVIERRWKTIRVDVTNYKKLCDQAFNLDWSINKLVTYYLDLAPKLVTLATEDVTNPEDHVTKKEIG